MNIPSKKEAIACEKTLKALNINIPAGVEIAINLQEIVEDLEKGNSAEDIIRKYDIKLKPTSFTTIFKNTFGVSTKDVRLISGRWKMQDAMRTNGVSEDVIAKILKEI